MPLPHRSRRWPTHCCLPTNRDGKGFRSSRRVARRKLSWLYISLLNQAIMTSVDDEVIFRVFADRVFTARLFSVGISLVSLVPDAVKPRFCKPFDTLYVFDAKHSCAVLFVTWFGHRVVRVSRRANKGTLRELAATFGRTRRPPLWWNRTRSTRGRGWTAQDNMEKDEAFPQTCVLLRLTLWYVLWFTEECIAIWVINLELMFTKKIFTRL